MFHSARIKLTAWYLLIIMLISVMFSVIIYRVLTDEIDRFEEAQRLRIERRLENNPFFPPDSKLRDEILPLLTSELASDTRHRIIVRLFIMNGVILLLSGAFGYILAGRTLQPIQEMMDEQNRFISDASHELKTPLTSLKSAFEVFLRDKNNTLKEAHAIIKESVTEVNSLQSLSESLLELAQYQQPNGHNDFVQVAFVEIAEQAVHKIEPLAKQKKITINKKIDKTLLNGNKYALTDLLVILLDNAIKYSKTKSTILFTAEKTDGSLKISVADTGSGIAKKDLPHIFDRFYRADTARTKSKKDGYGLGLAIAKKIVDTHHGSITVKSAPNQGTTFIVLLPRK